MSIKHTISTMIETILENNRRFVDEKGYEPHVTDGRPKMKLAIVTCMDTRLSVMLPQALGLRNGDAKIIKVAGGTILNEYDNVMRSLLVAIYELDCEEIMVIHHSNCGACHMNGHHMVELMKKKGISDEAIAKAAGKVDLEKYLEGFHNTEESVRRTVETIKTHPLVPQSVAVRGFIIDSTTGLLTEIN